MDLRRIEIDQSTGVAVKVLLSFSFAVRLGFWMLLIGFTAGLLVGYHATVKA